MITIPGYDILHPIYECPRSLVYSATRNSDGCAVVLKILKEEYPTPEEITRYRHEYEITRFLNGSGVKGVLETLGLEEHENILAIVFEDFGGVDLKQCLGKRSFSLEESLVIALNIAEVVGNIHAAKVIHKDINPSNILLHPETGRIRIIDFGNSTRLSRENPTMKSPGVLEGTLAYIAPEQTGRMNRSIDYRTDYYSMGATFYELFTGRKPFDVQDPIELIHCHMAKLPLPLSADRSEIPESVSKIVLKLLRKNAEERYQSTIGIVADLRECLYQLRTTGRIEGLALGMHDRTDRFQIPEKLYGRDRETGGLIDAFSRVAEGRSELMLVSGPAGIGKTALVREIYKPLTEKRAYFISGKFDQYHRAVPYNALIKAFQDMIRQILSESPQRMSNWREAILTALGASGRVMVDVIPELELIIGPQPPIQELSPSEAQNRFHIVFNRFIEALHGPEHPLVVFLDDLQWADYASLRLIQVVMTGSERGHLLVIGAYRQEEVNQTHPLMLTLSKIRETTAVVNHVRLNPLSLPHVVQLASETLCCTPEQAAPLGELVLEKTGGNPFFMGELLRSLYAEKLVEFDPGRGCWGWDLERIRKKEMTDNVVDLMVSKLKGLKGEVQEVLKLASCIGSPFDLHTLAIIHQRSPQEIGDRLWEATVEGMLYPVGDTYKYVDLDARQDLIRETRYIFCHDRIQQAAYSLIPEEGRREVHWKVGDLLLRNTPPDAMDRRLFDIVNHLNKGIGPSIGTEERVELARLNLEAGRKAKASAAYSAAFECLKMGIDLLPENGWETDYDLSLALHSEAAEAAYVCALYDDMERFAGKVLEKARSLLDRMKVHETRLLAYTGQNRPQETVKEAVEVLKLLGISLPRPSTANVLISLLRTKVALGGKSVEDLILLPEMTDPHMLAATRILAIASSAAFHSDPRMLALIEIKLVRLSLKYGNAPESPFAYACYGFFVCGALGQIDPGYDFGKLALRLLEQSRKKEFRCRTLFTFNVTTRHWKEHARDTLSDLLNTYQIGLETGDIEFAAFSGLLYCLHSFFMGKELIGLDEEMSHYGDAILRLNQEPVLNIHKARRQMVLNLIHPGEDPCALIGESYDEREMLPRNLEANDLSTLYAVYLSKLMLCFLLGDFRKAVENAVSAEKYLTGVKGLIDVTLLNFYGSLARLSLFPEVSRAERNRFIRKVSADQKKLKKWADHAPMNHLHKYCLVEAERQRVLGRDERSIDLYDEAISHARKNGFIQEEALAGELAAKYWVGRGKNHFGRFYMRRALSKYRQWGAKAKVQMLEEKYSDLLPNSSSKDQRPFGMQSGSYGSYSDSSAKPLDANAMMKASQAISGEIELDALLRRIMSIVIETAGAEKGFLILIDGEQLFVEARTESETVEESRMETQAGPLFEGFSRSIVFYVARTKNMVVLNDAAQEGRFNWDEYVRREKPKSILCIPIVHKGTANRVLYMENNLISGAFTPGHVEVLQLLASQAAVSIENAGFYRKLEDSEKKYRSLFENALEGIYQIGYNGRFISVNPAVARIMGYDSADEFLSSVTDFRKQCFVYPEDARRLYSLLERDLSAIGFEAELRRKDSTVIWASMSTRTVRDEHGIVLHYEGSLEDITERKEREKAEREREAAQAASRAKSVFLASMSHEIRTPMNAILGMSDLLWESPLSPEQREYLRISRNAGQGLLDLINEVLDLSKIEAGQLSLEQTRFDLLDVITQVCEVMAVKAHEKGIELTYKVHPQTPLHLTGDPTRLRQILFNLVGNGVKFTSKGEIGVECRPVSPAGPGPTTGIEGLAEAQLLFSVRDTGIGISSEKQQEIFRSFTQADSSTTRQYGGTGLGLTISKHLVEKMGGRIWVESELGKGSTFFFTTQLPIDNDGASLPDAGKTAPDTAVPALKPLKILLFEDARENQIVIKSYLKSTPFQIEVAENGKVGIEKFIAGRFDLVLMDMRMPIMDGYQATEEIRKWERLNGRPGVPIIALTADALKEDRDRCISLGCSGYLSKPVRKEQLLNTICDYAAKKV
ncbi:MAG: response regulator [Desulfobacteraceae bacterium]|nr:MAG: response regulator [Desulfobacteraceae bacterium]